MCADYRITGQKEQNVKYLEDFGSDGHIRKVGGVKEKLSSDSCLSCPFQIHKAKM